MGTIITMIMITIIRTAAAAADMITPTTITTTIIMEPMATSISAMARLGPRLRA